jgi:DNA-binding NtrC family response regulator
MVMADRLNDQILLIDDDDVFLESTKFMLEMAGIGPVAFINDSRQVMSRLLDYSPQVILLDLTMPNLSGLDLLPEIHKHHPNVSIIIMTGIQELETAVECMKLGATDFLTKPVERTHLISRVMKTLEVHELRKKLTKVSNHLLTGHLDQEEVFADIVTDSPKMLRVFQYLESIAHSLEPILITGETGVGKELISKAIHGLLDKSRPFIIENVAGLDDSMFSDTLFGHVQGAFTGADTIRQGLAEKAGNGTLVIDEIGDLSAASQVKLLRLIQERTFTPLGSDTPKVRTPDPVFLFRRTVLYSTIRNAKNFSWCT